MADPVLRRPGLLGPPEKPTADESMQEFLDKAALATAAVPIAGDIVGGAADVGHLIEDPSLGNAGLLAAGLIPGIPAGAVLREAGAFAKKLTPSEGKFFKEILDSPADRRELLEEVPGIRFEGERLIVPDATTADKLANYVEETVILNMGEGAKLPPSFYKADFIKKFGELAKGGAVKSAQMTALRYAAGGYVRRI